MKSVGSCSPRKLQIVFNLLAKCDEDLQAHTSVELHIYMCVNQIVYYIKKGAHTLMLEKIVAGHDIGPYCTTVIYRTRIELLCSPTLLEYFAPKGQEDIYIPTR